MYDQPPIRPATLAPWQALAKLRQLSRHELKSLFQTLAAPRLDEMNGEFSASLLSQGNFLHDAIIHVVFNTPGSWLGKAFQPLSSSEGHGYNTFRYRSGVRRQLRMRTYLSASELDDSLSYCLDYSPFNRGVVGRMAGEIRKFADGLYLGIGMAGPTATWRRKIPFALVGPIASFVGADSDGLTLDGSQAA